MHASAHQAGLESSLKVLLIDPNVDLPIDVRSSPSLGLAYLAAISERRGDDVRVLDMQVEGTPLRQAVSEHPPDVVGITATTIQIERAWQLARELRDLTEAPIILGGPHPTVLPDESVQMPGVDAVVRGEGEQTWVELCERMESGDSFQGVGGVTYEQNGEAVHNPDRRVIENVDSLPFPAFHQFKMDLYSNLQPTLDEIEGPSYPILSSRGCPYRCNYCSQILPRGWRARSPESVVSEWRWLVNELGAAEIGVLDDSFNIDRQRVLDICDRLVAEGLSRVPWIMINGIRANLVDEELLGRMREAGCIRTAFGVESGNQRILDEVIHKQLTLDQVRAAFRAAKVVGMETIGFFIIGLPGETEETMEDTIRFACELDPVVANFSMATPFPGTDMYEQVKKTGRLLVRDWHEFAFFENKAQFETEDLPAELVERKWREAYRRFYLRPHRVARTVLRRRTWLGLPRTVRMAWKTVVSP
jgi:anaerobic magnesium-protoporphyrin IX monomethyl ester cyclase